MTTESAATPEQVALRRLAKSLRVVSEQVDPTLPKAYRDGVRDGLRVAMQTAQEIADEWGTA